MLRSRGGFLFKAAMAVDGTLHLGVVPVIVGDVRNMHHAIKLPVEAELTASGFFSSIGELEVVLVPRGMVAQHTEATRAEAERLVPTLTRQLLDWGLSPNMPLAWIFGKSLSECGLLADPPPTLGELAERLGA